MIGCICGFLLVTSGFLTPRITKPFDEGRLSVCLDFTSLNISSKTVQVSYFLIGPSADTEGTQSHSKLGDRLP